MEPGDGFPASISSGVVGYILHHASLLKLEANDSISPEYFPYI
jgi:hypothetical protein